MSKALSYTFLSIFLFIVIKKINIFKIQNIHLPCIYRFAKDLNESYCQNNHLSDLNIKFAQTDTNLYYYLILIRRKKNMMKFEFMILI